MTFCPEHPKRDKIRKHPRPFHMGVPPPPPRGSWVHVSAILLTCCQHESCMVVIVCKRAKWTTTNFIIVFRPKFREIPVTYSSFWIIEIIRLYCYAFHIIILVRQTSEKTGHSWERSFPRPRVQTSSGNSPISTFCGLANGTPILVVTKKKQMLPAIWNTMKLHCT